MELGHYTTTDVTKPSAKEELNEFSVVHVTTADSM